MGLSNWQRGVWPPLAAGIEQLLAWGAARGIIAHVTSARRTHAQQRALYRRYLAGMNPYPVAPPGKSDHEVGYAVDVWSGSAANNAILGRAWIAAGGKWSASDEVHFAVR